MSHDFPKIDFVQFHETELPARIERGNGRSAFRACASLGGLGLRLHGSDLAYSYLPRDGTIVVRPGAEDASTEVEIEEQDFSDLVHELAAAAGLFYPGRVRVTRGAPRTFLAWEPGWRALFNGRPVYERAAIDLRDRRDQPLDLSASFAVTDPLEELAHFLRTAGYLHVRSVFRSSEVGDFRAAAASLAEAATEEDGNSWWGITSKGEKVLTRVLDARAAPELHQLVHDPRLTRLVECAHLDLEPDLQGEAVTVLFKRHDVTEGLADLPWHRDCGMGGHAIACPTLNLSVFLTPANRETGGLWMLPGSAPFSCAPDLFREDEPEGSVLLEAEPGDVTLHLSDTMHAAFPPSGDGTLRESLILTWKPPNARPHDGQSHYNDAIKGDGGIPLAGRTGR